MKIDLQKLHYLKILDLEINEFRLFPARAFSIPPRTSLPQLHTMLYKFINYNKYNEFLIGR